MGAGPAEIQIAHRRARRESILVNLTRKQFSVEDVSANQPEPLLEIGRCQDETPFDGARNVRCKAAEDFYNAVGRSFALGLRPSTRTIVRKVLRKDREDVFTRRR